MKRLSIVLLLLLSAAPRAQQSTPPEIPFESVANFLKLPADMNFGEGAGVAVNSKGRIFVFTRGNVSGPAFGATAAQLLEFGPDGKFIREIGKGLYAFAYAHTVRVDKDDNIWTVDKGSDMVVKFNPDGHVLMMFGRKKEASDEAEPWTPRRLRPRRHVNGLFRQPTDVAWNAAGRHLHQRRLHQRARREVRQERRLGEVVRRAWKRARAARTSRTASRRRCRQHLRRRPRQQPHPGVRWRRQGPAANQDQRACPRRMQPVIGDPLNPDAAPTNQTPGTPWAICITPGPNQFLYASDAFPGRIYKLDLQGNVLGMLGRAGRQPKQFGWIHEIACPSENELYVAEVINWRVQKLLLRPERGTATASR